MSAATQPNFPQADFPLVDAKGVVTEPWARFFQFIWQKVGGSGAPTSSLYLAVINGAIHVFDASTGTDVGTIVTTTSIGEAVIVVNPTSSTSAAFSPARSGFVVAAAGGTMTISRNTGNFQFSTDGGAVPVMKNDFVVVSWPVGSPVQVRFFPN